MLRVRYSCNELNIEGSAQDFLTLRDEICKLINDASSLSLEVICDTNFDPSPYDTKCEKIYVIVASGSNIFSVSDLILRVEGSVIALKNWSDNFPDDKVKYDGSIQYHHHYDTYSFPEFVSNQSPEVVLSLLQ